MRGPQIRKPLAYAIANLIFCRDLALGLINSFLKAGQIPFRFAYRSLGWPKLGPGKLVVGSSRQLASANGRQQPQPIPKRLSSYPRPSSGHDIGSNKYLDKAEWASKPLPQ
jgi:hypothetical protein